MQSHPLVEQQGKSPAVGMLILDNVRCLGERGLADELETGVAAVGGPMVRLKPFVAQKTKGVRE